MCCSGEGPGWGVDGALGEWRRVWAEEEGCDGFVWVDGVGWEGGGGVEVGGFEEGEGGAGEVVGSCWGVEEEVISWSMVFLFMYLDTHGIGQLRCWDCS